MKHTPGPWIAKVYKRTNKCFVSPANGGPILFEQTTTATETISPDARLIAAAPELLDALKRTIELFPLDWQTNPDNSLNNFDKETMLAILNAIAKAEGEK